MKVLVLQGGSGNLGDTAMLEGVVLNLVRNLPQAQLFVADRPGLRTNIWDLPRVQRQRIPWLVFPYELALARAPYLWRYSEKWNRTVRRSLPLGLGRIFSAKSIGTRDLGPRESSPSLEEFCEQFDVLHMVGGGYLTDTFPELMVQVCCLARTFAEQGKPFLLTGQQIGPFDSGILKMFAASVLRRARFVGLREPVASVELCRKFGLDSKRFRVMGDDSFGLPFSSEAEVSACLTTHGLEPGAFLAFNVRLAPYAAGHSEYLPWIASFADKLAEAFRLPVVIVPIAFNEGDSDDRSGQQLLDLMRQADVRRIDSRHLTPGLARGLLSKAFGAVGVSYHFCTFALSQGVPTVCLHKGDYYAQKGRGIRKFWQDERLAISLAKADVCSAVQQTTALLNDSERRTQLRQRAQFAVEDWRSQFDEQVQLNFGVCQVPESRQAVRSQGYFCKS